MGDPLEKSPDAFRTISEAAEELDLPQHVLRFWETRFATIKPLKRGGGRRYYRPEDVLLLKGIRHLLYDQGFTIKGVQRIIKEQGARYVVSIGEGHPVGPLTRHAEDEEDASGPGLQPGAMGISTEDREKLGGVLRDLLEMKRMLERAREGT
jgi:DNA-binding transcriptional MerR regulator